ncbi:MAG TPA: apolipoprotein N-acyltransferase [Candidatus Mcinerneyibacterium sp.]|nr:apolipoprotein N-acyltransferase [Candidatus Mcinerneyibacterium sp.]
MNLLKKHKYLFFFLYIFIGILTFSPVISFLVSLISLIPLFYFLFLQKNLKSSIKISFYAGFGFYLANSYWMFRFTVAGIIMVALYLSIFWILISIIFYYLKNKRYFLFYLPLAWTILEIIRGYGKLGYSWGEIGYASFNSTYFLNLSAIGGVHLLTFIIVTINLLITIYLYKKNPKYIYSAGIILLVSIILGSIIFYNKKPKSRKYLNIAMVQPSINLYEKWDKEFIDAMMKEYYKLGIGHSQKTDLVIWPETAFVNGILNYKLDRETIRSILKDQKSKAAHLVGTSLRKNYKNYNSLFLVDRFGNYDYYSKIKLVPVSEYLPLKEHLDFLLDIYPIQYLLERGENYKVFKLSNVSFSGIICFESIFPQFFNKFIENGAEFFVVSTNDGWFYNTLVPYQHLMISKVRAVEYNRYVAHCANSGISAIITNRGKILRKLGEMKKGVVEGKVYSINKKSFYYYIKDSYWLIFLLTAFFLFLYERYFLKKE